MNLEMGILLAYKEAWNGINHASVERRSSFWEQSKSQLWEKNKSGVEMSMMRIFIFEW